MPQKDIILNPADRSKLDNIVRQMLANKETDANIQFVVDDFKAKYGVKKKNLQIHRLRMGSLHFVCKMQHRLILLLKKLRLILIKWPSLLAE
jgi:hypothetical protein